MNEELQQIADAADARHLFDQIVEAVLQQLQENWEGEIDAEAQAEFEASKVRMNALYADYSLIVANLITKNLRDVELSEVVQVLQSKPIQQFLKARKSILKESNQQFEKISMQMEAAALYGGRAE